MKTWGHLSPYCFWSSRLWGSPIPLMHVGPCTRAGILLICWQMPWPKKAASGSKWATRFSDPPVQCLQRWWSNHAFYPCSFIKQTVGFTYTSSLLICHLWLINSLRIMEKEDGKCWGICPGREFGDLESRVLPLPKGCNSAHVTTFCRQWVLLVTWGPGKPTCQPWVKGRGSNSEEQVDGEAGSMAVKEQIDNHIHGSMVETNRLWAWALQRPIVEKNKWLSWVIILSKISAISLSDSSHFQQILYLFL